MAALGPLLRASPARRAGLALLLGLLLAAVGALWQKRDNQRGLDKAFDVEVDALADALVERLHTYEYGLRGVRGAVLTVGLDRMQRERFRVYHQSRDLPTEFPGALGFGVIRRVPPAQTDAFLAAARADGAPGFTLQQLAPHDGDRYIIQYIEPAHANLFALGLDIASEGNRRSAARRAMLQSAPAITEPITLLQAIGRPRQGFLVLLPIYRPGMPLADAEQREAATDGWSYTPLVIEDVLVSLRPQLTALSLTLADAGPGSTGLPFYGPVGGAQDAVAEATGAPEAPAVAGLQRERMRTVYGRPWRMAMRAAPAFVQRHRHLQPTTVFAAGALSAVLAAGLLYAHLLARRRKAVAREGQRRLATIVDNASDAIISTRLDGRISSWNRAAERIFGHRPEQALDQPLTELLLAPGHRADELKAFEGLRAGQRLPLRQLQGLHRDGQGVPLEVSSSAILDSAGQMVGIGHTLRDTSDRQRAEAQLRAFNSQLEQQVAERTAQLEAARLELQTILDAVPSMLGYWDRQWVNRFANRAYRERFGAGAPSPIGRSIGELMPAELLAQVRPWLQAALAGERGRVELSLERADGGGLRHWLMHCLPAVVDGQVHGAYELVQDVTEITEGRRRLADSEAFLERVGRVAGVGGWQLDVASGAITWSTQTRRIHDVDDEVQVQLLDGLSFYPPQARPVIERAVRDAVEQGRGWDLELPFVTARGRAIWVRTVGEAERAPAADGQSPGPVLRLVGAFQDISQRRQADEALRRLDAALAANAAKSDFLATMSHEIRTPMNAVLGLAYLLEHTALNAEQQDLMAKLQLSGRLLLSVINDVLDLSRIEAGEMVLEQAPLSLPRLVGDVVDMLRSSARTKGLALRLELPADLPDPLLGDALRLRQVLSNLVANALKFTERGQVTVRLSLADAPAPAAGHSAVAGAGADADEADRASRVPLCIEVIDTGIGMSDELQSRLFSPFTQGDASTTRRFGGSGLGLSIVYRLLRMMDGEVAVHSSPGQGSRFVLTLALRRPRAGDLAAGPDSLRLLVASTDAAHARRLAELAGGFGWQAEVLNAEMTLADALAQRCARGQPAHALLADDQLLLAQQHDLAALRQRLDAQQWPALVAMASTDADPTDPAGPPDPAAPPRLAPSADSSALFNALSAAMAASPGGQERLALATRFDTVHCRWLPGLRLMVVDDSEINREVARRILQREGAVVTLCRDGSEAVTALRLQPQAQDLVLMDVQMPGMDGYSATRHLRELPGLAELPVIALSAGALAGEQVLAIAAGMNDFVAKPLEPAALIRTLRRHMDRLHGKPWPVQPGLAPAPATPAEAAGWPPIAGIDTAQAAVRLGGDQALLASTLQRLLAEFADFSMPPAWPQPMPPEQRDALAARLHKLRGGAGLLAAQGVALPADAAEQALRGGDDAGATAAMRTLATALQALGEAAEPWLAQRRAAAPVGPPAPPLSAQALARLVDLLRRQDLAALAELQAADSALRGQLGEQRHRALRQALDGLDFAQAAELLQAAQAR